MGRKRKAVKNCSERNMVKEAVPLEGCGRIRKRFVGIRQRASGRWVAEIKDTIRKIRVWLGTFYTAEEAARAYDEAACLLRGANTRTNFWSSSSSSPALPSKITNLLLQRLEARNNSMVPSSNSLLTLHEKRQALRQWQYLEEPTEPANCDHIIETQFSDYLNDPDEYAISNEDLCNNNLTFDDIRSSFESCLMEREEFSGGADEIKENVEEEIDQNVLGFQFVDDIGALYYHSPFEIAARIDQEPMVEENCGDDEPSMVREAMKRMKYERKFSASLYAFNGIPECLKLKIGSGRMSKVSTNWVLQ